MLKAILVSSLFCAIAPAGEYAVLGNGFRIHADSHASDGDMVVLQTPQGEIRLPANMIASFEREEYTPPPPPSVAPPAMPAQQVDRSMTPQQLVTRAAEQAGLPAAIVHSVAKAESAYRAEAISPKGAIGLMQLMPKTAADFNADPHDPAQNAAAGAQYLRQLLEKYEGDPHQVSKAIAAYNAGPGAVDKYKGVPPYHETVQYVNRVLREYEKEQKQKKSATD